MTDKLFAKHVIVEGRVQGVFFRKNTKQKAQELNITGWVKNTSDNKVEIFAFGNTEDLSKFITWCKQGPPKAIVQNIHVEEIEIKDKPGEFSIVYDD
jgi:acylphosphatase